MGQIFATGGCWADQGLDDSQQPGWVLKDMVIYGPVVYVGDPEFWVFAQACAEQKTSV